jgi:hypothetical protein
MGGLCSITTDFKIFKMLFSFLIFKKKQIRYCKVLGPMIQSFTLPLHRCIIFTTFILQVIAIMIRILRQVVGSLILPLYRCMGIQFIMCVIYRSHHGSLLIGESFLLPHTARLNYNTNDSADDSVILRINT